MKDRRGNSYCLRKQRSCEIRGEFKADD
jgi:hypothetical protein